MEPKLPAPNRGPEYGSPAASQGHERQVPAFSPERAAERRPEQLERASGEVLTTQVLPPILPPPVVAPQPPIPINESQQPAVAAMPLVANDDDLIEKEWVDKAKKIVIATKDDPYRRETEVGKLQVDYLRKRYGRELGVSE